MTIDNINWGDLCPKRFLAEYWQKKPLLIKQAFSNFEDPIDANELAGLAMEAEIESRIIQQPSQGNWQLFHGPFDDFSKFGENDWTLLVQAVNNWSRPSQQLLNAFDFVPGWRLDDVMVSFSTPNGSVGAHIDQYDVFIIQGSGQRHWQVGLPDSNLENLLPHPDLKQVSEFAPIIDEITEAGDLLYIPPNHPHKGVAIKNSMNFSIGFQAPSSQELWSSFADKLIDKNLGEQRFTDPERTLSTASEELTELDIEQLKQFMLAQINQPKFFKQFIGQHLTQSHHALEILVPMQPIDDQKLNDILAEQDIKFVPVSGIKSSIIVEQHPELFINGESFNIDENTLALAKALAQSISMSTTEMKTYLTCLKNRQLLTSVLNKGYWYIE